MVDNRKTPPRTCCRVLTIAGAGVATILAALAPAPAQTRDCEPANGCVGYRHGMRVFAQNPTASGVIAHNERFIDLGTKTFNGQTCESGVIRLGRNSDRVLDPAATQDTARRPGDDGGRPIQGCAP